MAEDLSYDSPVNPCRGTTTMCTGDTESNMWWREKAPGYEGECVLDSLTYGQVIAVLERHPKAAEHLLRITDDPTLVRLANTVRLVEPEIVSNKRATNLINANTYQYYTLFRGNIDGTPGPGRGRG
jgi:hypothetical protein